MEIDQHSNSSPQNTKVSIKDRNDEHSSKSSPNHKSKSHSNSIPHQQKQPSATFLTRNSSSSSFFSGSAVMSNNNSVHGTLSYNGSNSNGLHSSNSFIQQNSQTSARQSLVLRRQNNNLLRRTSSFGGGPVVVTQPPPHPIHVVQSSSHIRWIVLFLSCLLLFGNYYAYDNPAALNKPMQEYLGHDYDQYQYELNLLYSVYSFPNMFLPVIGGQMVDRMDPKKVLILFSAFVCIGQTIFSWGVSLKTFWIMILGRILFGIGGESISVIQASITTNWFKSKELAFALGLNLSIARLGSVVNANMSPRIEKSLNVPAAVWTGTLMCYISFGSALLLVLILKTHSPKCVNHGDYSKLELISTEVSPNDNHDLSPIVTSHQRESWSFQMIIHHLRKSWHSIFLFPFSFWLVCLICVLLYSTVVPFNNIASDFLMSKWYPNDTISAGFAMSIPDTISAFLVPISGYFVDRYGGRPLLLIICGLVIACVHFTLGWTMVNPIIPLIFLGISYSIYGVAIWPSIATIIEHHENSILVENGNEEPPKLLGTAYGISTSVLNTGLTIMPVLAAQVRVWGGSFTSVELFFVFLALFGSIASGILYFIDYLNGGILQKPEIVKDDDSLSAEPHSSSFYQDGSNHHYTWIRDDHDIHGSSTSYDDDQSKTLSNHKDTSTNIPSNLSSSIFSTPNKKSSKENHNKHDHGYPSSQGASLSKPHQQIQTALRKDNKLKSLLSKYGSDKHNQELY